MDESFSNHMTYEKLNPNSNSSQSKIGQWPKSSKIGQYHPVIFFFEKMIPVKTNYKTHDQELLAIIKAFKTWRYYFKDCKYKVFVFIDHNNLPQFMDTKSLSSHQVGWAQELS